VGVYWYRARAGGGRLDRKPTAAHTHTEATLLTPLALSGEERHPAEHGPAVPQRLEVGGFGKAGNQRSSTSEPRTKRGSVSDVESKPKWAV
jgi:hypothetical protein